MKLIINNLLILFIVKYKKNKKFLRFYFISSASDFL